MSPDQRRSLAIDGLTSSIVDQPELQPTSEQRWALGIEYDGSAFHGYQVQANRAATVQQALETALSEVAGHRVHLYCAGRTDAGVHATNQVVHFDAQTVRPPRAWIQGVNSLTAHAVTVRWAVPVEPDFHARFRALARRYLYVIAESPTRLALGRGHIAVVRAALDVEAMDCAARQLLGQHDFSAFRAAGCQARTPVRDIRLFRVRRSGGLVLVDVVANAFLQHMVRNLVGSLLLIGDGRRDSAWLRAVLERRDRRLAGPTAAAAGLYLTAVDYVRDYGFDSGHRLPWFINQGDGGP